MKVFISWSGERSKAMAAALKEWLPMALQNVEPWMSDDDVQAGERWANSVATELQNCNVGIVCVTSENLTSEWLHFEAGALSKSMNDGAVITALLDLDIKDVAGHLTQFQMKKLDKGGVLDIARAINSHSGGRLDEANLANLVTGLWGVLEERFQQIPDAGTSTKQTRSRTDVLEDVVMNVRGLRHQIDELHEDRLVSRRSKLLFRRHSLHPMLLHDLAEITAVGGNKDDPMALLVLAGFARQELPWMSEVLIEFYRNFKTAESEDEWVDHDMRLRMLSDRLQKNPTVMERMVSSKAEHRMIRDFFMALEITVDRLRYHKTRDDEGEVVPLSDEDLDEEGKI